MPPGYTSIADGSDTAPARRGTGNRALLYGSAGVAATAIIPAGLQLSSNAARFRTKHADLAWVPMVGPDRVGGMVVARF